MIISPGATSQTITIQIVDDTGLAVTGLVAATFPTTYYQRAVEALPAAITLSDLEATNSAYSSGGVKELTGGYYRLDVPNAAFATASRVRIIGEASGKHIIYPPIDVSLIRALNGDGDAIPTAAEIRDVSNASPAANSLGAAVNEAAGSATNAISYITTALNRLGAWSGTGINTILGWAKSTAKKDATAPSDIGGTFDPATDSLEALRERGDSGAWGSDATAIADSLIAAVDETGLKASSFTPEALDQLRAAEIDLSQWDPDTDPVKIYRGVDHLHATGNAFTFRNVAGNWPDLTGCTIRMELIIDGVTAIAGAGTIVTASGANQEFYIQVLRTAFDGSLIKDKTGVFRCVRIDGSGNRFPLANGVATLFPNTAPAA